MKWRRREFLTRTVLGGATALALSACGGGGGGNRDQAETVRQATRKLDTLVPKWLERTGVPGAAVSVVYRGATIYARGFGVRRVDQPDRVDADTVFQLASVSKSVGSTVMTAQMPGGAFATGPAIDWNTPIQRLMPDYQLDYLDPEMNAQLQLGDLYAHRSGLPDHAGDRLEDIGYDRATILQRLRYVPLDAFGSYAYTNFGLTSAAQAMADARGVAWETLSQNSLYGPLGMARTSSRFADFEARSNRAWGHVQKDGSYATYGQMPTQYVVQQPPRDPDAQAPAGGVSSSVNDMALWMQLVLAGGNWQGKQLLSPAGLKAAMSPQSNGGKYGYGFNVGADAAGHPFVSHSGAFMMGAGTAFYLWPEEELGITVLTNTQPRGFAEAVALAFGEMALGAAPGEPSVDDWLTFLQNADAFHDLYLPFGSLVGQKAPAAPRAPSQPLSAYVGTYTNTYYGPAQIVLDADGNTLELIMGPAAIHYRLSHWDGDEFTFALDSENAAPGSISALQFAPQRMQIEYFGDDLTHGVFVR